MLYRVCGHYRADWEHGCGDCRGHEARVQLDTILQADDLPDAARQAVTTVTSHVYRTTEAVDVSNVACIQPGSQHVEVEPEITLAPPDHCMRVAGAPMLFDYEN